VGQTLHHGEGFHGGQVSFANAFRADGDIFLHVNVLRRFGLDDLATGEAIYLRAVDGENGLVAIEVRRWNFVPPSDAASETTSQAPL
jgi:cold shock CspA family protein